MGKDRETRSENDVQTIPPGVEFFSISQMESKVAERIQAIKSDGFGSENGPVLTNLYTWNILSNNDNVLLYSCKANDNSISQFDYYQVRTYYEGITAFELANFFWEPSLRLQWEVSVETLPNVLSKPNSQTVILHQIFKSVPLVKTRYTIFWSHLMTENSSLLSDLQDQSIISSCAVVNQSTNFPVTDDNLLRLCNKQIFLSLDVTMLCVTRLKSHVAGPISARSSLGRRDVVTELIYVSRVDPGGWAPVSLARITCAHEYPRFAKRLGRAALQHCCHSSTEAPVDGEAPMMWCGNQ